MNTDKLNNFIVIIDGDLKLNFKSVSHGFQNNYWFFRLVIFLMYFFVMQLENIHTKFVCCFFLI